MISSLEISNFLSIAYIHLNDLDDVDVIGIMGSYANLSGYSNGSGKSALAESIWFALTGKHRYKVDKDVVRIGKTASFVKLILTDGKHIILIDRRLRVKSNGRSTQSTAIVELDGEIKASSTTAANAFIEEYFNVSAKDFLSAYFFRQGEYDEFVNLRSGKRISFLEDFFGATHFDTARSIAVKRSNKAVKERDQLQGRLDALDEEIQETDEGSMNEEQFVIKEKLKSLQSKKETTLVKLENIKKKLDKYSLFIQKKDELEAIKKDKEKIDDAVATLTTDIDIYVQSVKIKQKGMPKEKDCIFVGKEKLQSLRKSVRDSSVEEGKIGVQLEIFSSRLFEVSDNKCSVCNRTINESLRDKLKSEITAAMADLELKRRSVHSNIVNLEQDIAALEREENRVLFKVKTKRAIEVEISAINIDLSSARATLEEKQAVCSSLKDDLESATAELTELQSVVCDFDSDTLEKDKSLWEDHLSRVATAMSDKEKRLSVLDDRLRRLSDKKVLKHEISKSWQKLNEEISDLVLLADLFNKCRFMVLTTGIDELQSYANEVIAEIGAAHKEIALKTDKETQSGSVVDSLDVYLIDSKGERLIEGLCGGEKNTVVFSIRTALARYKLCRMDSKIDFLILDEVFAALDYNSRREMVAAINMFKKDFSQIVVISHTDVQDMLDHVIEVEMVNDITQLKSYN